MCGRFGLFAELDALAEQFNFDPSIVQDIYSPRWNIPPTVPVAFAGIWATERADGGDIDACAVITCSANELVTPVHQCMPVILPPEAYADWLSPEAAVEDLLALVQPTEWPDVAHHTVSRDVNRAVNDHPALVERAARELQFDLAGASDC